MKKVVNQFEYREFPSINHLNEEEQLAVSSAIVAAKDAYAPYSGFSVGCALLLDNDKIVIGSNQENAAYPSGMCAERVALYAAGAQYPNAKIKLLAVVAMTNGELVDTVTAPCGACRQVIVESQHRGGSAFPIILAGKKSVIKIDNPKDLLPLAFGPWDLE